MTDKTTRFIKAMLLRMLRTFCQGALAYIGTSAMLMSDVDWLGVVSAGFFAAIVSMLMSCATGLPEVDGGDGDGVVE